MDVTTGALAADNERNLWASRERPFLAIATKHTNVGNPPDVVRIPVHSRLCTGSEEAAPINFELATKLEDFMPTCGQWIGTHNTPLCACSVLIPYFVKMLVRLKAFPSTTCTKREI